jgi:hypothetical protein
MAGHWTDTFSFLTGSIRDKECCFIILLTDEAEKRNLACSGIVQWVPEGWGDGGQVQWRTIGTALTKTPLIQLIAVGESGNLLLIGSGDRHEEMIEIENYTWKNRGKLRNVRNIDDLIFVVGMDRQVYKRNELGNWELFEKGIEQNTTKNIYGFESIDGFSKDSLYAVGWEGEIWNFEKDVWKPQNSPTENILVDVCCAGNGYVYACGRRGLILRGKNGNWEILKQNNFSEDIWSIVWFNEKLYCATMTKIYTLNSDNILEYENMGEDSAKTCYKLDARDGVLWSFGEKDLMSFDGLNWKRIDG